MDPTEIELSDEQRAQLEQDMLEREAQERELLATMDQENLNQGAPEQPQVQQQQEAQPVEEIEVQPQDPETSQNINGEVFPTQESQAILRLVMQH